MSKKVSKSATQSASKSTSVSAIGKKWKNFKQLTSVEKGASIPKDVAYYAQIEAPPSVLPKQKYCDVTGLIAKYSDPRTGLYFHNADVYKFIEGLSNDTLQAFLALRNAHVQLK